MPIHHRDGMRIRTDLIYPPIPERKFDWSAVNDETYDYAPDAKQEPVGHGATEEEAINDLLMLYEPPDNLFDDETCDHKG